MSDIKREESINEIKKSIEEKMKSSHKLSLNIF